MYGYRREEQAEIEQETREMPTRARRSLAPESDPRIRRQGTQLHSLTLFYCGPLGAHVVVHHVH